MIGKPGVAGDGAYVAYKSRLWAQVRTPTKVGSRIVEFEDAVRPPGVRIIAYDAVARSVYLTREYRRETQDWDWRVPGGKVFDCVDDYLPHYFSELTPVGLDLPAAVLRAAGVEAAEEIGVELADPRIVGLSVAGSTVHWDLYFVCGQVAEVRGNRPEVGEQIEVRRLGWVEALDLVDSGAMSEDRSAMRLRRILVGLLAGGGA